MYGFLGVDTTFEIERERASYTDSSLARSSMLLERAPETSATRRTLNFDFFLSLHAIVLIVSMRYI